MEPVNPRVARELTRLTHRLQKAGAIGDAWIVGGTVRDILIGREPGDVDITAADAGDFARRLAGHHGTNIVTVGRDIKTFRVPTPRDAESGGGASGYVDVAPLQGETIEADLARRDFTINALAVPIDRETRILDPFRGVNDAQRGVIRMTSETNLDEDPLRILRALRFASSLGFEIETSTWQAVVTRRDALASVAEERVQYELSRIVATPAGVELLQRSGFGDLLFGTPFPASLCRQLSADGITNLALIGLELDVEEPAAALLGRRWPATIARRVETLTVLAALDWTRPATHVLPLFRAGEVDARRLVELLDAIDRDDEAEILRVFVEDRPAGWWEMRPLLGGDVIRSRYTLEGSAIGRSLELLLEKQLRGEVRSEDDAHLAMLEISRSV